MSEDFSEYLDKHAERQYMHQDLGYQFREAVRTETRGRPLSQQYEIWRIK